MIDVWVFPALLLLVGGVCVFFILMKVKGGSGVRTDGKTVHDQPVQEDDNPPPA